MPSPFLETYPLPQSPFPQSPFPPPVNQPVPRLNHEWVQVQPNPSEWTKPQRMRTGSPVPVVPEIHACRHCLQRTEEPQLDQECPARLRMWLDRVWTLVTQEGNHFPSPAYLMGLEKAVMLQNQKAAVMWIHLLPDPDLATMLAATNQEPVNLLWTQAMQRFGLVTDPGDRIYEMARNRLTVFLSEREAR